MHSCFVNQKWEETADDLGGGVYRITDFMHSGYGLVLTIKDGKLSLSLPAGSPLYTEDDWGGYGYGTPAIWWFTDDYVHLYPYGKDGGVAVVGHCYIYDYYHILTSSADENVLDHHIIILIVTTED